MRKNAWIVAAAVVGIALAFTFLGRPAGVRVSADTFEQTYGGPWPLTVPKAMLDCSPERAVTVTVEGVTFVANGLNPRLRKRYPDWLTIDPIWAAAPPKYIGNVNVAAPKVDIGPLIRAGLALCD